jgi:signal transduction histidine kinase
MAAGTNSGPEVSETSGEGPPLTHRDYLGQRLFLHTRVRLLFALLIALGALFAKYLLGVRDLDLSGLLVLAAVVAGYNAVAWSIGRSLRRPEVVPADHARLVVPMYAAIALDQVALTVGVWLVGGARSPFLAFYLVHVSLGYLNLSRRAALSFTVLAYALLTLLVLLEWLRVLPPELPSGAVEGVEPLDGRFAVTVLVVYGLLFALVSFLLAGIARLLRQGERRIRLANAELSRLSEMRRDFLHIASHNLQAPIGAVTMFLRNLESGLGGPVTEKQAEWIDRSLARLAETTEFMVNLRTLSGLEADMIRAAAEPVNLAEVLRELVEENQDLARERGHTLTLDVPRSLPSVVGHRRLLREALVNYLTNALKYTPEGGKIIVRGLAEKPHVLVEVEDDGVGISEEDQARLFGEFVRVGGKPKVKGSGLGLSIVKRVVEAHGGTVGVRSAPGEGSTFWLRLPEG